MRKNAPVTRTGADITVNLLQLSYPAQNAKSTLQLTPLSDSVRASSCLLPSASGADGKGWQHLCELVKSNATVDTLLECYANLNEQSRDIALRVRHHYCHRHNLSVHDVLRGCGDLSIAYLCEKQSLEACSVLAALSAHLAEQAARQAAQ